MSTLKFEHKPTERQGFSCFEEVKPLSFQQKEVVSVRQFAKKLFSQKMNDIKGSLKKSKKLCNRVKKQRLSRFKKFFLRIWTVFSRVLLGRESSAAQKLDSDAELKEWEDWLLATTACLEKHVKTNDFISPDGEKLKSSSTFLDHLDNLAKELREHEKSIQIYVEILGVKKKSQFDELLYTQAFFALDKDTQLAIKKLFQRSLKKKVDFQSIPLLLVNDSSLRKKVISLLKVTSKRKKKQLALHEAVLKKRYCTQLEFPQPPQSLGIKNPVTAGFVQSSLGKSDKLEKYIYSADIESVCPDIKPEEVKPLRVTMVGVEFEGLAQQGGLGEALAGLSRGLTSNEGEKNDQVRLVFPEYSSLPPHVKEELSKIKYTHCPLENGEMLSFKTIMLKGGVECTFISHPLFQLDKDKPDIYGPEFQTVGRRFAVFSDLASELLYRERDEIDVIHLHDAHVAGVVLKLKRSHKKEWKEGKTPPVVFTYHNNSPGAQGRIILGPYNYSPIVHEYVRTGILKKNDNLFVKALKLCDAASTVSEGFAQESQQKHGGEGVAFAVKGAAKVGKLVGILNGIDTKHWNPETDSVLKAFQVSEKSQAVDLSFDLENGLLYEKRQLAKQQLAQWVSRYRSELSGGKAGSTVSWNPDKPIMTYIGRYDSYQKGIHHLPEAIKAALKQGGQFICMGSGEDPKSTEILDKLAKEYAGNPDVLIIRDHKTQKGQYFWQQSRSCGPLIRAATDFLFIPSNFEPCGLVQFEAWAFGSLVVGADVGGLSDTIKPLSRNLETSKWTGNGFKFSKSIHKSHEVKKVVSSSFKQYAEISSKDRNSLMRHLILEGRAHGWTDSSSKMSPVDQYRTLYQLARTRATDRANSNIKQESSVNRRIPLNSQKKKLQGYHYPEERFLKDLYVSKKGSEELCKSYFKIDEDRRHQLPSPFARGVEYRQYEQYGAFDHGAKIEFRLQAEQAKTVVLEVFNTSEKKIYEVELKKDEKGDWKATLPKHIIASELERTQYRYRVNGTVKIDPYARQIVPSKDENESPYCVLQCENHQWKDSPWINQRDKDVTEEKPVSIYELHPTTWKKKNGKFLTYQELGKEIVAHHKKVGFTHVELMGICHYPEESSWGYQVTGYFAPNSRLGTPEDFKQMIDFLHQNGVGVILDWIPNHCSYTDHGLGNFDGTSKFETGFETSEAGLMNLWNKWGHHFNYRKKSVRDFLISSAHFWMDEMHIDGMRVDAVRSILGRGDPTSKLFLRDLNVLIHEKFPGAITIAEEYKGHPKITHSPAEEGYGFDYKWHVGWTSHFLSYFKKNAKHRKNHYTDLVKMITSDEFHKQMMVISHDHVASRACTLMQMTPGLKDHEKFSNIRAALSLMMCLPGKKLFFMGAELGNTTPWDTLFDQAKGLLDLDANSVTGEAKKTCEMILWLNQFYQGCPAFYQHDDNSHGLDWIEKQDPKNRVVAYRRQDDSNESFACFHNFSTDSIMSYEVTMDQFEGLAEKPEVIFYSEQGYANLTEQVFLTFDVERNAYQINVPPLCTLIVKEGKLVKKKEKVNDS